MRDEVEEIDFPPHVPHTEDPQVMGEVDKFDNPEECTVITLNPEVLSSLLDARIVTIPFDRDHTTGAVIRLREDKGRDAEFTSDDLPEGFDLPGDDDGDGVSEE